MKSKNSKLVRSIIFLFVSINLLSTALAYESYSKESELKLPFLDSEDREPKVVGGKDEATGKTKKKKKKKPSDDDGKVECGGTLRGPLGRLRYETHPVVDRFVRQNEGENPVLPYSNFTGEVPQNCIWIVKLGSRSRPQRDATIVLTVEKWRLSPGSTLNFYPENQLQTEFPQPIMFMNTNHSKINDAGVVRFTGQSFVVILSSRSSSREPMEPDARLSLHFRWFSETKVGDGEINSEGGMNKKGEMNSKLAITTTTNYVTSFTDKGWVFWNSNEFRLRQKSTWVLNAGEGSKNPDNFNSDQKDVPSSAFRFSDDQPPNPMYMYNANGQPYLQLNLTVDMDMMSRDLLSMESTDSCDRSSFQMFEILTGGRLRRVVRHCRGLMRLGVSGITNQLLVFIKTNSTERLGNAFNFVEIQWEFQKVKIEVTTTTTTTEAPTTPPPPTEAPPTRIRRCPSIKSIAPCTCFNSSRTDEINVECFGHSITQQHVNNFFAKVRRVNKLPSDAWIILGKFRLQNTLIPQLDLLTFFRMEAKVLDICFNRNLKRFTMSHRNFSINPKPMIRVTKFRVVESPLLGDDGFGRTLRYFSPIMKELVLFKNKISGHLSAETDSKPRSASGSKFKSESGSSSKTFTINRNSAKFKKVKDKSPDDSVHFKNPEFLPGLSRLTELSGIHLNFNEIRRLGPRRFQDNTKLLFLSLPGNKMEKVEPDSFVFSNAGPAELKRIPLKIDLSRNLLNASGFPSNTGMNEIARPVYLDLGENIFDEFPRDIFEPFLRINRMGPRNTMSVRNNPIMCDNRVSWLKTLTASVEDTFLNSMCIDEPGHSVFSSTSVGPARSGLNATSSSTPAPTTTSTLTSIILS